MAFSVACIARQDGREGLLSRYLGASLSLSHYIISYIWRYSFVSRVTGWHLGMGGLGALYSLIGLGFGCLGLGLGLTFGLDRGNNGGAHDEAIMMTRL